MVRHRWRIIYKFGGAALDTVAVLQRLPFSWTNDQMASLSSESVGRRPAFSNSPLPPIFSTPVHLKYILKGA